MNIVKKNMIYKFCRSNIILLFMLLLLSCNNSTKPKPVPMKTIFVVEKVYHNMDAEGISIYSIKVINSSYNDVNFRLVDSIDKFKAGDVIYFDKK